jgi:MSHA biogenesis protein MshI
MIKWPWQKAPAGERLVVCSRADSFAYVQADRPGTLRRCGVELRGAGSPADFARRLRGLGLPAREVSAVLPLRDGQLLQVDAPAVKPEEMKAAARWRIKNLVDDRLDDMTIDVMMVGDDRKPAHRQIFVAAASNTTLREVGELTRGAGLELSVVELMETSQRNLQTAIVSAEGLAGNGGDFLFAEQFLAEIDGIDAHGFDVDEEVEGTEGFHDFDVPDVAEAAEHVLAADIELVPHVTHDLLVALEGGDGAVLGEGGGV